MPGRPPQCVRRRGRCALKLVLRSREKQKQPKRVFAGEVPARTGAVEGRSDQVDLGPVRFFAASLAESPNRGHLHAALAPFPGPFLTPTGFESAFIRRKRVNLFDGISGRCHSGTAAKPGSCLVVQSGPEDGRSRQPNRNLCEDAAHRNFRLPLLAAQHWRVVQHSESNAAGCTHGVNGRISPAIIFFTALVLTGTQFGIE